MKVLFHVHGWPPVHNAGAEMMAQAIAEGLIARGHTCRVITGHNMLGGPAHGWVNGVEVFCSFPDGEAGQEALYRDSDIVITHLDISRHVIRWARQYGRPLVHIVHNPWTLSAWEIKSQDIDLLIFNSKWLARDQWARHPHPGIVIYPPVWRDSYRVGRTSRLPREARHIGLLNLNENKGGPLFWSLARANPDRLFLACVGAYDAQQIESLPNVKLVQHTSDVRNEVYNHLDLLLVPSQVETWGRVAVEAACSGIPVLASPTPGLQEAMGRGGIFINRDDQPAWQQWIEKLDEDSLWSGYSEYFDIRSQALEVECEYQLDCLEKALLSTASRDPRRVWGFCTTAPEAYKLRASMGLVPARNQGPVVFETEEAREGCMTWGLVALPGSAFSSASQDPDATAQARISGMGGPLGKIGIWEESFSETSARKHGMTGDGFLKSLPVPRLNQASPAEAWSTWGQLFFTQMDALLKQADAPFREQVPPVRVVVLRDYQGQEGFIKEARRIWVSPERATQLKRVGLAEVIESGIEIPRWETQYYKPDLTLPGVSDQNQDPRQAFRRHMARGILE